MNTSHTTFRSSVALLLVATLAMLAGCGAREHAGSEDVVAFGTADQAVDALVTAFRREDTAELARLLGSGTDELLDSGDAVADQQDRARFVAAYEAKHSLATEGDTATLVVGENDWSLPIPLVKRDGKWTWDGAAGVDELIYRRVGGNELGAIEVMRGFVTAQQAYAAEGRDGDPAGIYALKLISDDGLHNGLYWPTTDDEPPSPANRFVAAAAEEGYARSEDRVPYHGYYYRLLYAQGPNANGGARDYFRDGLLTEGFAMVAWPADYGSSGVQTFVVNQDGVVFQKDLGAETATAVETIDTFDPDSSWVAVVPPEAAATTAPAVATAPSAAN